MSIIKKKYDEGGTQLNKLKFAPSMGSGHPGKPPLKGRPIPIEGTSGPDYKPVNERVDDITRITKLFTRKEGTGFIINQAMLKNTGGETAKKRSSAAGFLASTIGQTAVSGTGIHLVAGRLFGTPPKGHNELSHTTKLIGQPGSVSVRYGRDSMLGKSRSNYGVDDVNNAGPYPGLNSNGNIDDYIKFFFEVITPGEENNIFIQFRALLDSFDDNYTSTWSPINYVGRGEQFYTYQNFNRTVNINFKSSVATKIELRPVYQKLAYLASTTAPSYSDNGLMRGTVVKLNIGDYLSDTPGFLTSVTYGWESRYPFEIARGKKDNSETDNTDPQYAQELPHVLNCSLSFTPIHTFAPQTGLYHYITNPTPDSSRFFTEGQKLKTNEQQKQQNESPAFGGQPSFGDLGSGF